MKINKIRFFIQILSFLLLIYGFYWGLRFKTFMPAWLCTNPTNFSSSCYLLPLQRLQYNIDIGGAANHCGGAPFPLYAVLWGAGEAFFVFFGSRFVFVIIFNRLWCGWNCPFGTLQEIIFLIGKKISFWRIQFSEKAKLILSPIKYINLFLMFILLILFVFGLGGSTPIFCRICPAKSFLPIFEGNFRNLSIGYPPGVLPSIITCVLAGMILILAIFKERFFCYVCPVSGLINLFNKFSFLKLKKNYTVCINCKKCLGVCPMQIKEQALKNENADMSSEDCIMCLKCIASCPRPGGIFINLVVKVSNFFKSVAIKLKIK